MATPNKTVNPLYTGNSSDEASHPGAPGGGGGCGAFNLPGPAGARSYDVYSNIPHPFSPAGRYLRNEQVQKAAAAAKKTAELYFAIYYTVSDDAFKKAADTWRRSKGLTDSCGPDRCYLGIAVKSEPDFKDAWKRIHKTATQGNYKVVEGHLFTHASIRTGANQGLEFARDTNDPNADDSGAGETTLQASEISSLEVLPWSFGGQLWLHGCNTGVDREGWSPAQSFANRQRVTTYGQMGYAYFSEQSDDYDRLDSWGDDPVYLRAYQRSSNVKQGSQATGKAIQEKKCEPQ